MAATRQLFGGAITASTPADLIDVSDIRQIPDNQEVFLYRGSDVSIVFEVLQRVDVADDGDAIRFHYSSLAHDNSAKTANVLEIGPFQNPRPPGSRTPLPIILSGMQEIPKFRQDRPDLVKIFMALYRVESKNVDLVVTLNVPIASADGGVAAEAELDKAKNDFLQLVETLEIVDFDLFA